MRTPALAIIALLAIGLSESFLVSQTILTSNPVANSGGSVHKNSVRDSAGNLWVASIFQDPALNRAVVIQVSSDGGQNWVTAFVVNDAATGLTPPNASNMCALAIDSTNVLHVVFGSYYYPSYFNQYYRRLDPVAGPSPIVNLSSALGVAVSSRTDASAIVVDSADTVWIAAPTTASWSSQLLRSNQPSASSLSFTSVGNIASSASSQAPELCVDSQGRIHSTFYNNLGSGNYAHRIYDPVAGWSATTVIGNTTPTNDYFGRLAADSLGNIHALFVMDAAATTPWLFRYKRWDATNGWSPEVPLFDAQVAQYTGISSYLIFALGCNESTGLVYAVYRDLSATGSLRLATKGLADTGFTNLPDLAPGTSTQNEFLYPTVRGSLFPTFNQTSTDVDVIVRYLASPTATPSLLFARVPFGVPGATLSLTGPATVGGITQLILSSPLDPFDQYLCGFSGGSSPGFALSDGRIVPLNPDLLLAFSITPNNGVFFNNAGFLDGSGQGTVTIAIPPIPALVGTTIVAAFVVGDPLAPSLIGNISPPLAFTIL